MVREKLGDVIGRRVLVCDGAMGTQLIARGLVAGECGELWNVQRSADVEAIHRSYLNAGCSLITTNTFGASSFSLAKSGLAERTVEINRAGATLARRAAGDAAWVLGDIGPFGDFLEPLGDMTPDRLAEVFRQQAQALAEGGVDAFIIETMQDPNELAIAVKAARSVSPAPIIATYAFGKSEAGFRTMMGCSVDAAMKAAIDAGADVVGANCGTALGLDDYVRLAGQLVAAAAGKPVILQPNAGSPQYSDGKLVYGATPADMAAVVPALLKAGLKVIGGCCGTTPEHLKAMAACV